MSAHILISFVGDQEAPSVSIGVATMGSSMEFHQEIKIEFPYVTKPSHSPVYIQRK